MEKSIWKDGDAKLSGVANSLIDRITKADFSAVIFDGFVLNERLFHVVFLLFPIFIEVLACWKRSID